MSFDFVDKKIKDLVEGTELSEEVSDQIDYIFDEEEESEEKILSESEEENLTEDEDDIDILEEMDKYLVEAMKEQMRLEVVAEKDSSDEEKINKIKKISTLTFEEEDVIDFANQYITPVLEICESFINEDSKDAVVIPLVVYEIAAILEDAKDGRLTDIYMSEDDEEHTITDVEKTDQEEEVEEEGGENKEVKEADEESMVTDTEADTDDTDEDDKKELEAQPKVDNTNAVISSEMAMELINLSLDEHGITDKNDRDSAINEAINLMALFGFDSLRPNVFEVVENIYYHDRKAEGKGQKRFFEIMEDIKSGDNFPVENFGVLEDISNSIVGEYYIQEGTEERILNFISGGYENLQEITYDELKARVSPFVKGAWGDVQKAKSNAWGRISGRVKSLHVGKLAKRSAVAGGVLTAATILAISIAAYRNKKYGVCQVVKNRYDKVKCLISACEDAIRAIKAQKHGCKEFAKSPVKCEMRSDKLIIKWEKKKQRYIKKLASVKAREDNRVKKYSKKISKKK